MKRFRVFHSHHLYFVSVIRFGCLTFGFYRVSLVSAFIVKRFRVFRAPLQSCFPSFRIYRETLSRFSCAASGTSSGVVLVHQL
ncbi:hypothetical protein ABLN64_06915 [Mycobacterium tuberculosis]